MIEKFYEYLKENKLELTNQGNTLLKNKKIKLNNIEELQLIITEKEIKLLKNYTSLGNNIKDIVYQLKNYYKLIRRNLYDK